MAQSAFETLRAATLRYKQKRHYQRYSHLLSESVRWNIQKGDGISAADLLQAEANPISYISTFLTFLKNLISLRPLVPEFRLSFIHKQRY